MTKTTEELKREMYGKLAAFKIYAVTLETLEDSLEAYLEALRQESIAKDVRIDHLERMGDVMRDGYMYQQQLTAQARNEADSERNRRQAFEFANKSAGEFLQEARAKVKSQRISIGKLKNERDNAVHALKVKTSKLEKALQELSELRKVLPATPARNGGALISCAKCGGSGRLFAGIRVEDSAHVTVPCPKCAHLRLGDSGGSV